MKRYSIYIGAGKIYIKGYIRFMMRGVNRYKTEDKRERGKCARMNRVDKS